jgi:hypothetical protein
MRRTLIAALAVAAALALPASAAAATKHVLARGVLPNAGGGFAWELRAERQKTAGIPGMCLEADHSWDPSGTSFGNVSVRCVAGSVGGRFSLHAGACDGVYAVQATGSLGDQRIRKLLFALDPRARSLKLVFKDGTRATLRTHRAPRRLRLPVRFAWQVDAGESFVRRAVAYGAKRKGRRPVVGRLAKRC